MTNNNNIKTYKIFDDINSNEKNFIEENMSFIELQKYHIQSFSEDSTEFELIYDNNSILLSTNLLGVHNILNASLAIACARSMNISMEKIIKSIKNVVLTDMRFQKIEKDNVIFINDAYNASPLSMEKAITTFSQIYNDKKKIAILGDMLELGDDEILFHTSLSDLILNANIENCYFYGERMYHLYNKLVELNNKKQTYCFFKDKNDIIERLKKYDNEKIVVLLKGSRGMKLEEIIEK